jgi:glycosyltransferase involved in cell wall biosynthesis
MNGVAARGVHDVLVVDRLTPRIPVAEAPDADAKPVSWDEMLRAVAQCMTGSPPQFFRWRSIFSGRYAFYSWRPTFGILLAALLGRRSVYLCWGFPKPERSRVMTFVKAARLSAILRCVDVVIVNDALTRAEIRRMVGRDALIMPTAVDTDFYRFAPAADREDFFLVPGDADRDEVLLAQLAARGVRIIRVARSARVAEAHRRADCAATVEVRLCVSYAELRSLYQRASAVLLPLTTESHAAGQTVLLEAVASGAPVIISGTRSSDILGQQKTIFVCASRRAEDWLAKIAELRELLRREPDCTRLAAESIRRTHCHAAFRDRLVAVLRGS